MRRHETESVVVVPLVGLVVWAVIVAAPAFVQLVTVAVDAVFCRVPSGNLMPSVPAVPPISSLALGAVVPIPTCPLSDYAPTTGIPSASEANANFWS